MVAIDLESFNRSINVAGKVSLLPKSSFSCVLCLFAAIFGFPSPFAAWRLSDYAYQQWDYAFEDVLEFVWTIRPRDVPDADALDVSWRRS